MRRRHIVPLLAILLCTSAAAEDARKVAPLKLEDLVRRAQKRSPTVHASTQRIRAARAQLSEATISPFMQFQAEAAFAVAPGVKGTPIYAKSDDQFGFGEDWNIVAGGTVTGTIPLYTWGKILSARDAAKQGVRAAEFDRERVRAQLTFDIRRAYFGLQFALDVLQMISEGKGKLEDAATKLQERLDDGDEEVEQEDVWRLSSTVAEVEARQADAERLESSSRAALQILVDSPTVKVPDCPSERARVQFKPLQWYQKAARLHRPDGRMLDSAVRAQKEAEDVEFGRYFPDIGLVLRAGQTIAPEVTDQNNPFIVDGANFTTLGAGLAARWSLDFGGTYFRVKRARARGAELRAQRDRAQQGMQLQVADAYAQAQAAERAESAWAKGHRDTRRWFIAATQAYQIGAKETRDLVDAVRAYFNARTQHLDAIRRFNTAAAQLELATASSLTPSEREWEGECAYETTQ